MVFALSDQFVKDGVLISDDRYHENYKKENSLDQVGFARHRRIGCSTNKYYTHISVPHEVTFAHLVGPGTNP
jgi:hypothetical protein